MTVEEKDYIQLIEKYFFEVRKQSVWNKYIDIYSKKDIKPWERSIPQYKEKFYKV